MSDFRLNLRTKVIKDLKTSLSDGNHYLFLSNINNWANNGTDTPPAVTDTINDDIKIYNEMISAHKLASSDIFYALKKSTWISGTVYDMFASYKNNEFLNYFVTHEAGATVYVYVCVDNNKGIQSTVSPQDTSALSFTTSDGYAWKRVLAFANQLTINTQDFYAILANTNQSTQIQVGNIDKIDIVKTGKSFPYIVNATLDKNGPKIIQELDTNNDLILKIDISAANVPATPSDYTEYMVVVIDQNDGTILRMYGIDGATITGSNLTVSICPETQTVADDVNRAYAILPYIKTNGNGTGLSFYPVMNSDKTIKSIKILQVGSSYGELDLYLNTYEFRPVFNYKILSCNFIKDLNITNLFVYKKLTATSTPYTKLPIDLTLGSVGATVSGTVVDSYPTNEIRQFGIIGRNSFVAGDSEGAPFTTVTNNDLRGCDVLNVYKGTTSSKTFFNVNSTTLKNDDYVCQLDTNGNITAYGKVVSITYDVTDSTTIKTPKITIKTLFGTFVVSPSRSLRKYVLTSGTVTTTDTQILVELIEASQISRYEGKILYIDNITPVQLVANKDVEFKVIISI